MILVVYMTATEISKSYEFYAGADLSRYAGEWVAIVGNKVVAHGNSVKEIISKSSEAAPGKPPFIAKVPSNKILLW